MDTEVEKIYGGFHSFRENHPWFGAVVDVAVNFPVVTGVYLGNNWFLTNLSRLRHMFDQGLSNDTYFTRYRVRFDFIDARETPQENARVKEYGIERDVAHPDFKFFDIGSSSEPVVNFLLNDTQLSPPLYADIGWLLYQFLGLPSFGHIREFPVHDLLLIRLKGDPDRDGLPAIGLPRHGKPMWNLSDPHQIVGMGEDYIFLERFYARDFFQGASDIVSNTQIQVDIRERTTVKATSAHLTQSDGYRDVDLLTDTWFKVLRHLKGTGVNISPDPIEKLELINYDWVSNTFEGFYTSDQHLANYSDWFEGMGVWATSDRSGASSFRLVNTQRFSDMIDPTTPVPSDTPYSLVADEGAPLVATASDGFVYLAGIFSWSRFFHAEYPHQMGKFYPDVFVSVQHHLNWIQSVISSDRDIDHSFDSYEAVVEQQNDQYDDPLIQQSNETDNEFIDRLLDHYQELGSSLDNFTDILADLEQFSYIASDSEFIEITSDSVTFQSDTEIWINNIEAGNSDQIESDYAEYLDSFSRWISDRAQLLTLGEENNDNFWGDFVDQSYTRLTTLEPYNWLNTSFDNINWYYAKGTVIHSPNYYVVRVNSRDEESILKAREAFKLNRYQAYIRCSHLLSPSDSLTDVTAEMGFFNSDWGYMFRFGESGVEAVERLEGDDHVVPRSRWNIDPLDGSGISGVRLEKIPVRPRGDLDFRVDVFPQAPFTYWFRYEPDGWIYLGFRINGKILPAHVFAQRTHVLSDLPFQLRSSRGSTAQLSESRLHHMEIDADPRLVKQPDFLSLTGKRLSFGNVRSSVGTVTSAGLAIPINTPLLSLRARARANGMPPASILVTEIQLLAFTQVPRDNPEIPFNPAKMELYWELVLGADIRNTTWLERAPFNSELELDTSGDQYSEGRVIASGMTRGVENIEPEREFTGINLDNSGEVLTFAVRGIRSGLTSQSTLNSRNLDLWYLIKWREF